ncbi:MAG: SMC family ATPase, partial [Chloroflexi bacterium]|nr:SMC family ATPase [Chloroflexota bacterium]
MIPIRLRLRNFLSYGEPDQTLSFDGFRIACLCGENGHGKSALLDAITWAVWGRARGSERRDLSDDDLIQLGKTDMEVEFEFELGPNRYNVLRKRAVRQTARRRTSTGVLELQVVGPGDHPGHRPLTGESVAETQRKIDELLRLDYDTFINSAFILQGRADEFTRKTPTERKTILAELLGLERYDRLTEQARAEARRVEVNLRATEMEIQRLDDRLKEEPTYQRALDEAQQGVASLESSIHLGESRLVGLHQRRSALESKAQHHRLLDERATRFEREIQVLQQRIATQRRLIAEIEVVVARREAIQREMAELETVRRAEQALAAKLDPFLALTERRSRLERVIDEARYALDAERQLVASRIASLRREADRLPSLRREVAETRGGLEQVASVEGERDGHLQAISRFNQQAEELRRTDERLRAEQQRLAPQRDRIPGQRKLIAEIEVVVAQREAIQREMAELETVRRA